VQGTNKLQVLYKPPLGIFSTDAIMGPGSYRISLSPDANYQFSAIETLNPDAKNLTPGRGAGSPYTLRITDVKLYVSTAQLAKEYPVQSILHLHEYQAFSRTMSGPSANMQFQIPVSTESVYVFLQAPNAGSDPFYSPTAFKAVNDSDLNLQHLQVTFGQQTKPATRWSVGRPAPVIVGDFQQYSQQFLSHMYYAGLVDTDRANEACGTESLDEWLQRGPMFCFRFDRDESSRESDISVNIAYGATTATGKPFDPNSKLFIVCKYRTVRQITTQAGQITSVVGLEL
jgi:hypothetical protein